MKKMMWLFSILVFLFLGNVANAETDLLNLGSYNEGDIPSYGQDVIIRQDEKTGVKWITQSADAIGTGTIKFPINLSGDFELLIKISLKYEDMFITSDEYKIHLDFYNNIIRAGKDSAKLGESRAKKSSVNEIRISVVNNIAKIYMNDIFDGKISIKPDLVYTQLMFQEVGGYNKIYELTTSGTPSNNTVPATGEPQICNTVPPNSSTSENCTANYTNGQLHVPCVAVSDPFGGKTIYDIKMNQQSGSFTFDLDMGSVKPK